MTQQANPPPPGGTPGADNWWEAAKAILATAFGFAILANMGEILTVARQIVGVYYRRIIWGTTSAAIQGLFLPYWQRRDELIAANRRFFWWLSVMCFVVAGLGSFGSWLGGNARTVFHFLALAIGIVTWVITVMRITVPLALVAVATYGALFVANMAAAPPLWIASLVEHRLVASGAARIGRNGGLELQEGIDRTRETIRGIILDIFTVIMFIVTMTVCLRSVTLLFGTVLCLMIGAVLLAIAERMRWSVEFGRRLMFKVMLLLLTMVIVGSIARFLAPRSLTWFADAPIVADAYMFTMLNTLGPWDALVDFFDGTSTLHFVGAEPFLGIDHDLTWSEQLKLGVLLAIFWLGLPALLFSLRLWVWGFNPRRVDEVGTVSAVVVATGPVRVLAQPDMPDPYYKTVLKIAGLGVLALLLLAGGYWAYTWSYKRIGDRITKVAEQASVETVVTEGPQAPPERQRAETGGQAPSAPAEDARPRAGKEAAHAKMDCQTLLRDYPKSDAAGICRNNLAWQLYPR